MTGSFGAAGYRRWAALAVGLALAAAGCAATESPNAAWSGASADGLANPADGGAVDGAADSTAVSAADATTATDDDVWTAGTPASDDVALLPDDVTPCGPDQPCADDGEPCAVTSCQNGKCVLQWLANGSPCDDGQPCTVDSCKNGTCVGVQDDQLCPPKGPCETDNGGCGPSEFVACKAVDGKAQCIDVDECKTDNGGCGGKSWYTCTNQYAAPPTCKLVDGWHLPWTCGKTYTCTAGNNGTFHHNGLTKYAHDFGMPMGANIRAPRGGKVTAIYMNSKPGDACYDGCPYSVSSQKFTDCCKACGPKANTMYLRYDDGTVGHFVHIQAAKVKVGDVVKPGAIIATVGTNGCSTGPHLHTMRMVKGSDTKMGQSVPMSYIGVGNPKAGDKLKSANCL